MKTTKIIGAILVAVLALALFAGAGAALAYIAPVDGSVDLGETVTLVDSSAVVLNTLFPGRITADAVGTYVGTYKNAAELLLAGSGNTYQVYYPATTLSLYTSGTGNSVAGKTIYVGDAIDVLVSSNVIGQAYGTTSGQMTTADAYTGKLSFTSPDGGVTNTFASYHRGAAIGVGITTITTVGATDKTGDWTVVVKVAGMSKYASAAYTKSNAVTFTFGGTVSDTITSSKDVIVRGNSALLTFKGSPSDTVTVVITEENGIMVLPGQTDVTAAAGYISKFVVKLDATGTRVVEIDTDSGSGAKAYTFTGTFAATRLAATVTVTVQKGVITLTPDQGSYYIGDEITLSGTCTEGSSVYLYIKGTNARFAGLGSAPVIAAGVIAPPGGNLNILGGATTVTTESDNTWTKKFSLPIGYDAGTYTFYASTSQLDSVTPTFLSKISATAALRLKQPFLSATAPSSIVAKGDDIKISGTAEGANNGLYYYTFGTNYFYTGSITVSDDASYEVDIPTTDLDTGQYFVVVQHPMYDGNFNVGAANELVCLSAGTWTATNTKVLLETQRDVPTSYRWAVDTTIGSDYVLTGVATPVFADTATIPPSAVLFDASLRQSANAAEALCQALDTQNIDDIYVKLTFQVATPTITLKSIADQTVGSTLTVSGTTNVAAGESVTVEIISTTFTAVDKSSVSSASYLVQNTKVVAGSNGLNTYEVTFAGSLHVDSYTVSAQTPTGNDMSASTTFKVLEATPTATATKTATATATATPTKSPGFGAFLALAGLGAVAVLVLRRD